MKRMVIVGATSGMGLALARYFLERGWAVGVAGRRTELLEPLRAEIPDRVAIRAIDVTSEAAPAELWALIEELGGMDLYLHCAGIGYYNPALDAEKELRTVQTNALGFTRMVDAAFDWFRRAGGGRIACISSIAGTQGLGAAAAYSATKRYQNCYIDALAQLARMEKLPIRFTDIRPGFVDTALLADGRRYPMLMNVDHAVRRIGHALLRGRRRAVIDWKYALLVFFWRLIPTWLWERLPIRTK